MALPEPFPALDEILASIGAGGSHVAAIEASEGAAGNISVYVGWPMEVRRRFPIAEEIPLPQPAPHLAVHDDTVERTGTNFHAVVHAQPPRLTYLSHIAEYRNEQYLNRRLLRWEPETIINLPAGIGALEFMLPGSAPLMAANVRSLRAHRIVVWAKHGVMARSDISVKRAVDRIEYAETAANYEYMDLLIGGRAEGLSVDELRAVVTAFDVDTKLV